METGDRFAFNWIPWLENLPAPFEIADGVILPPGKYRFDRPVGEFESSPNRRVQFGNTSGFGTFYNGNLYQQSNYLRYTGRRGAWQAIIAFEQNFGRFPQGSFVQRLWQLNATYAINTYISLRTFFAIRLGFSAKAVTRFQKNPSCSHDREIMAGLRIGSDRYRDEEIPERSYFQMTNSVTEITIVKPVVAGHLLHRNED